MSRFQVTYPPKGEITFDGGINSKYSRALIAENESPDNLNCISSGDAVQTRGGTQKFNTTSVGSFACDGLFTRHDSSGSQSMVAWFGGSMYGITGTSTFTTVPSAQSVWTGGSKVYAAEYENKIFMGNGAAIPYKYDGTYFTRHGVYPPVSAPTYSTIGTASGASGTSTGTYYFKVTYVNSAAAEGNPSSASTGISMTCQTVTLDIPVAATSFGVAARNIYVASSPTASYIKVAQVADNSTATYQYASGQATLGTAIPTANGVPPNYNAIICHQNRLFVNDPSNPNYFYYSGLGEPYTFSALDFQQIGDGTADLVRGFGVQDNNLLIFCDNSTFIIYMSGDTFTDDTGWLPLRTKSAFGSRSPGAIFRYGNKVGFAAFEADQFVGFAAISNGAPSPSETLLTTGSIVSDLISDKIKPDMDLVPETMASHMRCIVFDGKAYISIAYGTNQTTNNRIYVYDFRREMRDSSDVSNESWFPWSYSALAPGPMCVYNGAVYFGSDSATGFVYKINYATYSDDGAAINSYYWTKEFSGLSTDINSTKDFRKVEFLFGRVGAYYMDFGFRTDSDLSGATVQQVSVAPGGSLWGTMVWGTDVWSAGFQDGEETTFIPASRGKRIQFYFSNRNIAGQAFKMIRMKFSYNNKGRR
jgi:hypothetical protein